MNEPLDERRSPFEMPVTGRSPGMMCHVRKLARIIDRDELDGVWRCWYCHIELEDLVTGRGACTSPYPELEHVVPKSRGGSNDMTNLVVACNSCNLRKGARLLSELSDDWHEWRDRTPVKFDILGRMR